VTLFRITGKIFSIAKIFEIYTRSAFVATVGNQIFVETYIRFKILRL
jgi:hypothetical protein